MSDDADPDEYFLPLEDQRVFGAGYRRKRIRFVPATDTASGTVDLNSRAASAPPQSQLSVGDKYLSLVLGHWDVSGSSDAGVAGREERRVATGNAHALRQSTTSTRSSPGLGAVERTGRHAPSETLQQRSDSQHSLNSPQVASEGEAMLCETCNRVIPDSSVPSIRQHEASFVHQVSLPHSHPPSAIDRSRTGYRYLQSHGWDPDARVGLGSVGQGIREPIKTRAKKDTVGLGIDVELLKRESKVVKKTEKKMNAKEVRRDELAKKEKGEKLRRMFYEKDDIQKYLEG